MISVAWYTPCDAISAACVCTLGSDSRLEELFGIGAAVLILLLVLFIVLVVVVVRHRKYLWRQHRRRQSSASHPSQTSVQRPVVDNWSIPRPRPRVWQTSASLVSDERRHKHHHDDDDNDDMELRGRWSNGHAVQPLHRPAVNGGLTLVQRPQPTSHGPTVADDFEPQTTPRLRRYVAYT